MKLTYYLIIIITVLNSCSRNSKEITETETHQKELYFPEINSVYWESTTTSILNWNTNNLIPLLDFLEEKNTKSFMILHKGKIVLEEYMNDHSNTKSWYWGSAGKTLTTAVTGIAQDEGLIHIEQKVSNYLGTGWTSATTAQENLITCKHLLSMNSGLDDRLGDGVSPDNLQYLTDAGSRWAYHNVYVKLQDVIASASNQEWSKYFNTKLRDKIGMTGQWTNLGDLSVYWSNTRSMARFGLLIAAQGKWGDTQIIPQDFLSEATNTSQNINKAYGYMWWLNGKDSYHLPASQIEFNGTLIPNAPDDMYAALGKNDQKIYIVPSKDLVIIRMGEAADEDNFALSNFDNDLWAKINALID
ncbi:serine hydrolase domain-containing protein [Algibacter pectinivorans]|uniref:CubicO group peptidase, beta-lactamase class C family n=1 Tax=Algibacter pectinivorans TaxID=870482 RepID=A0A1I1RC34_9FLAO|nr:serine hydrolase [Algibacter pectinivorans]SFD31849.1 CubicO group peptidase, beta-lactamase class C family [Algibacter pectinivorans]